jgi:hypothetical protein
LSRWLAGGLLGLLAIGGAACDLFESRDALEPKNRFPCSSLTERENVYQNIRLAYGRGDGLSCYLSNLDPTFRFYPDPADSIEAPANSFDNWDRTLEQDVTQLLAISTTSIGVAYKGTYELLATSDDSETRRYRYEIVYEGSVIPDTLMQGVADISIRKSNSGFWQVTTWVDRRDPAGTTSRTWGYLRYTHKF